MTLIETPNNDLTEDAQAKRFYDAVRENIIVLLLFLSLYSTSYNLIRRFRRKYKAEDIENEEEDAFGIDNLIMVFLCAAGLAMAFAGFFLLPGTMAATALIELRAGSYKYYLGWLDTNLLVTLWNYTFIGCNISLFGLLPFAYFYNETDQLKNFFAKARETLTIMLLVGLLIYCFIYVSKSILQMDNLPNLVVLNLLTCLGGGIICLTATPKGYVEIFSWISRLPLRPNHRKFLKNSLLKNKMETRSWEYKLEDVERALHSKNTDSMSRSATLVPSASSPISSSSQKLYASTSNIRYIKSPSETLLIKGEEIRAKLKKLELERYQIQTDLSHSPLYRNISFFLLFLLSHFIIFLLIGLVSFNFIKGIFVLENDTEQQKTLETVFGKQTSSFLKIFGALGRLSEIALILYFTLATIIGVYSKRPFAQLRPRWERMNMQKTIGNVALLLVISSSLPALVRVLGLTRFESAGPYENFHMLKNGYWVNMGFRISVLITSVFAILDYYVLGSLQLARRSMSHDGDEHEWNNNIQLAPPHPIHPHHPGNNYGFYVNGPLYPLYVNHDSEELLVIGKVNDGYPNGYVNGYIIGDGNGVTNDQSEESMHFYKDEYANGHTNGYTNGYAHGYENGHVSTEENGYINGYPMNGYLNGHINGYADTHER